MKALMARTAASAFIPTNRRVGYLSGNLNDPEPGMLVVQSVQ